MVGMSPQTCPFCGWPVEMIKPVSGEVVRCSSCGQALPASYTANRQASAAKRPTSRSEDNYAGSKAPVSLEWRPGEVILGQYEVLGLAGIGGMGRVYRVRHRAWRCDLALKAPRRSIFQHEHGVSNFTKECETWAGLGLYPHIVSCYFVRRFTGVPLVFVEYVEGGSLHEWIQSRKLYAGDPEEVLERILDIAIQMAWGLEYAHRLAIIHMDMKPANVLMHKDGRAKITDFGLSKARAVAGETVAPNTSILVSAGGMTAAYCSPEQQRGGMLSKQTDLWSWAVSVLEMFAGEVTWMSGAFAAQALESHLASATSKSKGGFPMPDAVANLLRHCFMPEPQQRPSGMDEIASRLSDIYHTLTGKPYPRHIPDQASGKEKTLRAASLNNQAVSLIELGQLKEAAHLLQKGLKLPEAASAPGLHQDIAYNYALMQVRHNPSVTADQIAKAVPKHGDPGRKAFLVGMLFLEMGELYRAIDTLVDAVEIAAPCQVDALNARGIALLLAGETQPAIMSFQAAMDRDPDRLDIVRNLALAYYYDRQINRALQLFDTLAKSMVFDSDDAIRYATVLSAAGRLPEADQYIQRAMEAPQLSSATLLTAAELYHGAQTFLPLVMPVRLGTMEHQVMLARITQNEPHNLRAQIDQETLPERLGYQGGAVITSGKRVLHTGPSAARVGGSLSASYSVLNHRHRWGNVNATSIRWKHLARAFGLAVVVALGCAMVFNPFDIHRIASMETWNDPYAQVLIPINDPFQFCLASMIRQTHWQKPGPDNPILLERIQHHAKILRDMAQVMLEAGEEATPTTRVAPIHASKNQLGESSNTPQAFYSFQIIQHDLIQDLSGHWGRALELLGNTFQMYLKLVEIAVKALTRVIAAMVFLTPTLLLLRGAPSRRLVGDLLIFILGPIAVLLLLTLLSGLISGMELKDVFHDFFNEIARIQSLPAAYARKGMSDWEGSYTMEVDQSLAADILALGFTEKSLLQIAVAMSLVFIASQVSLQLSACAWRSHASWRNIASHRWKNLRSHRRAPNLHRSGIISYLAGFLWNDRVHMTLNRAKAQIQATVWGIWDLLLLAEFAGFVVASFFLINLGPALLISILIAVIFALGALFRPSLLLLANFIAVELAFFGYLYGTLIMSRVIEQTRYGGMETVFSLQMIMVIVADVVFMLVSFLAIRRCPEHIPEWDTCRPDPWDIRQIVDPLNIRRYAAPWQLAQLEADSFSKESRT